jgi:hypothetical protein
MGGGNKVGMKRKWGVDGCRSKEVSHRRLALRLGLGVGAGTAG